MGEYGQRFNLAVAAELRAEIARKRTPVASIVETTGLSRSAVHRYLNGERDIPTVAFVEICAALGVSPLVIFERAQTVVPLETARTPSPQADL